jgi:hypothetical protein
MLGVIKCGIRGMAIMRLPRLRVRTYMLLVGVVALLVWATMIGVRWYEYSRRATIYSFQERHWRENAHRDLHQRNTRTIAATSGLQAADYYGRLVRKYRRAMWRPWIPVDWEPPLFYPDGPPRADGFDLRLVSWGDGSGVSASGINLAIVGTGNNGLLHIRIFDSGGLRMVDTDEKLLPTTKASAISTLKQQLPGLLPPHVLTGAEKARVLSDMLSIVGETPAEISQRTPDNR